MLKSELIAQRQAEVASAQSALEQAVRNLVSAEQSPDDWVVGVPQNSEIRTVEVGGVSFEGTDLAAALDALSGFDDVHDFGTEVNDASARIQSHTSPAPFMVKTEGFDTITQAWTPYQEYSATWTKLE